MTLYEQSKPIKLHCIQNQPIRWHYDLYQPIRWDFALLTFVGVGGRIWLGFLSQGTWLDEEACWDCMLYWMKGKIFQNILWTSTWWNLSCYAISWRGSLKSAKIESN